MSAPETILFVCQLNAVRSPMAEALAKQAGFAADSCGVSPANEADDLVIAVMKEVGIDLSDHEPAALTEFKGEHFDRIVTFTADTRDAAKAIFGDDANIEVWRVPNPNTGSYDVRAIMDTYRAIRDVIRMRLNRLAGS